MSPEIVTVTQPVNQRAGKVSVPPQSLPRGAWDHCGSPHPGPHSLHLQGQAEVQRGAAAHRDVVGEVPRPAGAKLAPQPTATPTEPPTIDCSAPSLHGPLRDCPTFGGKFPLRGARSGLPAARLSPEGTCPWGEEREPNPPAVMSWSAVLGGDGHRIFQHLDGGQGGRWVCKERGCWGREEGDKAGHK